MNDDETQLLSDIKEYGWHVILVDEDDEGPSFGYTIGLYKTYQHPEIILFGLKIELIHSIINIIGQNIASGISYIEGNEYDNILEGYNCKIIDVDHKRYEEYFGYALWYYNGSSFPAIQCVWPDKMHHYPWDEGFYKPWIIKQPILTDP